MDTKILRQKILDLAIHGKLVPQDPNDEPASVLLERIRAEKEQLIKEGKIKAPKKSKSAGDTSHYPKDVLPKSWCYVNFSDVITLISGRDLDNSLCNSECRGTPYLIGASCIDNGSIHFYRWTETPEVISFKDDILLSCKGTVGEVVINSIGEMHIARQFMAIRSKWTDLLLPGYIDIFIKSCVQNLKIAAKGIIPGISRIDLLGLGIAIPPISEQKRIIQRIGLLFNIISEIEENQFELKDVIVKSRERILDLAIHGKLVPQDPSDEPALKLLKRINPSFQPSHNLHYEGTLPNGWTVASMESFCTTINGLWKGDKEPLINVGVIRNANFTKDFSLDYSKIEYINVEERSFSKRNLKDGDIIVEKSGGSDNFPVGRSILYRGESGKYSFSNFTMSLRIRDKNHIIPEYLFYVLQSMYRRGDMRQMQTQTTGLHNLLTDVFMSAQIPIPPLNEQKRIVTAIENHFQTLDSVRSLLQD